MIELRAMHSGEADALGQVMWDAIHTGLSPYSAAQRHARPAAPQTHASLMAEGAFAASGFRVIGHETVARCGQDLARAQMEKVLP